jgi:hypothetical protein
LETVIDSAGQLNGQSNQVLDTIWDITQYSNREEWANMLISLGIEITGE